MSEYNPDCWVIIKLSGIDVQDGPLYKVLAGWYGGYTGGDSWKINSGITKITTVGDVYEVEGYSGSTYMCHKNVERMSGYTASILKDFVNQIGEKDVVIEVVDIETILDQFK